MHPSTMGPSSSPRLQDLPTELVLCIMKSLPDRRSLFSLLQTCRIFSTIFDSAEPQILKAILAQVFSPKAVPEALNVR
jgi:hypothetical protein